MHKHSPTANRQHPYLNVGSIVLLKNPLKPWVSRSMVKIVEIIHSGDGQIRWVKKQRPDNSLTNAAVSNLYPLELVALSSYDPVGQEEFLEGVDTDQVNNNGIILEI